MTTAIMDDSALLIELFTEELPPKALAKLGESFAASVHAQLLTYHLCGTSSQVTVFASPRRLAVRIAGVLQRAQDQQLDVKGPSIKVGLNAEGLPSEALKKWAERQGVAISDLQRGHDGKQEIFVGRVTQAGANLNGVIQTVITQALSSLPIPKMMRYQLADGVTTVSFVRPAHGLVVMLGSQVLDCEVLGLRSGNVSYGHRFLAPAPITIEHANTYESQLAAGKVIASFELRKDTIKEALLAQAAALGANLGTEPVTHALLDEVCALVEWPVVVVGQFEDHFLEVPQECLILTMRTNQKYFPLFDTNGALMSRFLVVSNMQVADPALIIDGNQRVVRPRLADAKFFFLQDQKTSLQQRSQQLHTVVYHAKLGTQAQRAQRVAAIATELAKASGAVLQTNEQHVQRAALLAKADLLSNMVGEFPELQGIMGRYYAINDGEPQAVAQAIAEHYQPRFAGDALPASPTGLVLAMADKLETLCGLFSIGQLPSGDKDPFALRRHALGVIRMLIEQRLPIGLQALIKMGFSPFDAGAADKTDALFVFFKDRLTSALKEAGYGTAEVQSVLANLQGPLFELPARLEAVKQFQLLPDAQGLAAANKRIQNILRKNEMANTSPLVTVQESLLSEPAEKALYAWLQANREPALKMMQQGQFTQCLLLTATVSQTVQQFFDQVMVMAPQTELRDNRVALLANLLQVMNQVADLSTLST
jgi:glycyl-tRNA synthetase beta chain